MTEFAWNEGRSIHVGIDRVDDAVFQGWLGELRSSEADARAMRDLADGLGFASRLIVGESATRENVCEALDATIERLVEGDALLVSFAGHMTTLTGVGDDGDGWDEAWCLRDGILLDDEFHDLLSDVPAGVDVLVVTDSCFAAGMTDGRQRVPDLAAIVRASGGGPPGDPVTERVPPPHATPFAASGLLDGTFRLAGGDLIPRAPDTRIGDLEIGRLVRMGAIPRGRSRPASERRAISARVVSLAAAAEGSLAYEGEHHGLFTAALLLAVERVGGPELSYGELMEAIAEHLPMQQPTIGVFGSAESDVIAARAFGSASAARASREGAGNRARFLETGDRGGPGSSMATVE